MNRRSVLKQLSLSVGATVDLHILAPDFALDVLTFHFCVFTGDHLSRLHDIFFHYRLFFTELDRVGLFLEGVTGNLGTSLLPCTGLGSSRFGFGELCLGLFALLLLLLIS